MKILYFKVSQLVILHEESESGTPIPDLSIPIRAVGAAVQHLIAVSNQFLCMKSDQLEFQILIWLEKQANFSGGTQTGPQYGNRWLVFCSTT